MASFTQILREQLTSKAARSDVLRPLAWFVALLLTAVIAGAQIKAPHWLLVLLATILLIACCLYLAAYGYCLFVDRDALRSERFVTDKLAIEKGVYGDDVTGIVVEAEVGETKVALPAPKRKADREK